MALVSPVEAPASITNAIRKASEATGVDFDYLLTTASRESNFKPQARARTSSAAGLFQFIESTWLQTVKEEGGRYGLEKYSPHIFRTESGNYTVPNRKIRSEILALRHNPEVSALMAGAFTRQNADYVSSKLGRDPTQGELYIAHFLGADGATKLITLASQKPDARADVYFQRAAQANKPIFYSHGQARSVRQVYDQLVSDHSRLESITMAASSPVQSRPPQSKTLPQAAYNASVSDTGPGAQPLAAAKNTDASQKTGTLAQALAQKSPPLVSLTRVAALAQSPIPVGGETMTDAGLGAIGPWHTIVKSDAVTMSHETSAANSGAPGEAQAETAGRRREVRLRHASAARPEKAVRSHGLFHRSAARLPPVKEDFASRFWELQALYGS